MKEDKNSKRSTYSAPQICRKTVESEQTFATSISDSNMTVSIDSWTYDPGSSSSTGIEDWTLDNN